MSSKNASPKDSKQTYFYVFVDREGSNKKYSNNEVPDDAISEVAPDHAVRLAFERLSHNYDNAECR
jgi:hypothetical protein